MSAAMRRLARHLFMLCSALSLLLCVAVCVLWVWSYAQALNLNHARPVVAGREATWAYVAHGRVWLGRMTHDRWLLGWHFARGEPGTVVCTHEILPNFPLGFGYTPRTTPDRMYGFA